MIIILTADMMLATDGSSSDKCCIAMRRYFSTDHFVMSSVNISSMFILLLYLDVLYIRKINLLYICDQLFSSISIAFTRIFFWVSFLYILAAVVST